MLKTKTKKTELQGSLRDAVTDLVQHRVLEFLLWMHSMPWRNTSAARTLRGLEQGALLPPKTELPPAAHSRTRINTQASPPQMQCLANCAVDCRPSNSFSLPFLHSPLSVIFFLFLRARHGAVLQPLLAQHTFCRLRPDLGRLYLIIAVVSG